MTTDINYSPEVQALKDGKLIVYPTEAVWGIGCDPMNAHAFDDLLAAKNRPMHKGVIIIAKDYSQLLPYINDEMIPMDRRSEIISSWPGAYTWLLPASKQAPEFITGGSELIAVRVTTHPTVRRMCEEFGGAIVSTSANLSGEATPTTLDGAKSVFGAKVAVYVDEPLGENKTPSKITNGMTGEVIRP
ncbi:MAG: Sua5/YciO/YrdC/YwlC family protein [Gammaproteobacteria bacterium]|nr:Sua5/YciO/YrdC/YwlC family protein [Gammaproteobacteria bacterium]